MKPHLALRRGSLLFTAVALAQDVYVLRKAYHRQEASQQPHHRCERPRPRFSFTMVDAGSTQDPWAPPDSRTCSSGIQGHRQVGAPPTTPSKACPEKVEGAYAAYRPNAAKPSDATAKLKQPKLPGRMRSRKPTATVSNAFGKSSNVAAKI